MRRKCLAVAVAVFSYFGSFVSGDCLLRRVAPDGAWATFHCNDKWDDGTEYAFYVTIKSVGGTTIDDQPARWIELKFHQRGDDNGSVWKILVLEEHLGPDGDALNNVVKGWRKHRDCDPTEIKDLNSDLPRLHLFISAPIKNLKKTDQRRTVEWQGGQLTCEVFEGSGQFEHKVGNDETHYLLSVHEKMPFGVAGATLNVKGDDGVTGTIEFRVVDFGANAISELPDFK